MGAAIAPAIISAASGLVGAVIGASAATVNQWRGRRSDSREKQRDRLVAFLHAADELTKGIYIECRFVHLDGILHVSFIDERESLERLRLQYNAASLSHTEVITGVGKKSLRRAVNDIAGKITSLWQYLINLDEVNRLPPGMTITFERETITDPLSMLKAIQPQLSDLADAVREEFVQ